jgi:hypothetical protein
MTNDREQTACCGLCCGDCIPSNRRLFDTAERLRQELEKCQFGAYAAYKSRSNRTFDHFETFREVLDALLTLRCARPCSQGGGRPNCPIRACAHGATESARDPATRRRALDRRTRPTLRVDRATGALASGPQPPTAESPAPSGRFRIHRVGSTRAGSAVQGISMPWPPPASGGVHPGIRRARLVHPRTHRLCPGRRHRGRLSPKGRGFCGRRRAVHPAGRGTRA